MLQETGKEPTDEDLACELGVEPDEIREVRKIAQRTTSLETPIGDEEDAELVTSSRTTAHPTRPKWSAPSSPGRACSVFCAAWMSARKQWWSSVSDSRASTRAPWPRSVRVSTSVGNVFARSKPKALEQIKAADEIQAMRETA